MTTLFTHQLETTLSQTINLNLQTRYVVAGIRPYIVIYNSPAGTFTFSIKQSGSTLGSASFTSSEIKSNIGTTDDYIHGLIRLDLENPLALKRGSYEIEMSSSGYTFSSSSFIGWLTRHEDIFVDVNGTPRDDRENPLTVELFEWKNPETVK